MSNEKNEVLIAEARQIIDDLGLPKKMLAKTQVYVFLILLGMSTELEWKDATNEHWRITPIIDKLKELKWADFKPNTRETIRDECVGVLVDAALVTPNPDDLERSKNSKNYCYQINPEVLKLVQSFGTQKYKKFLGEFLKNYKTLKEQYQSIRKAVRIPVTLPSGKEITLSPGGQNPLIAQVVKSFASLFELDQVLYIGDTEKRYLTFEKEMLRNLKVDVKALEKSIQMPDVILYRSDKNIIVLVEVVKTGGEINVERRNNLIKLFQGCSAKISFVNAFESFKALKKLLNTITWETHAWLADHPTHMIHFNGDKAISQKRIYQLRRSNENIPFW